MICIARATCKILKTIPKTCKIMVPAFPIIERIKSMEKRLSNETKTKIPMIREVREAL